MEHGGLQISRCNEIFTIIFLNDSGKKMEMDRTGTQYKKRYILSVNLNKP